MGTLTKEWFIANVIEPLYENANTYNVLKLQKYLTKIGEELYVKPNGTSLIFKVLYQGTPYYSADPSIEKNGVYSNSRIVNLPLSKDDRRVLAEHVYDIEQINDEQNMCSRFLALLLVDYAIGDVYGALPHVIKDQLPARTTQLLTPDSTLAVPISTVPKMELLCKTLKKRYISNLILID